MLEASLIDRYYGALAALGDFLKFKHWLVNSTYHSCMAVSAGHRIFGTPHLPPLGVPGLRKKVCSMRDHRHKNHVQPSQMIEYSSPIEFFLLIDANDFKLFSELRLHCLSTNPRRALPTIGIWDVCEMLSNLRLLRSSPTAMSGLPSRARFGWCQVSCMISRN